MIRSIAEHCELLSTLVIGLSLRRATGNKQAFVCEISQNLWHHFGLLIVWLELDEKWELCSCYRHDTEQISKTLILCCWLGSGCSFVACLLDLIFCRDSSVSADQLGSTKDSIRRVQKFLGGQSWTFRVFLNSCSWNSLSVYSCTAETKSTPLSQGRFHN